MTQSAHDQAKEKYRPDADPDLDRQLADALGTADLDALMNAGDTTDEGRTRISGDVKATVRTTDMNKAEVLVEIDGKNQGVVSIDEFDTPPQPGDVLEFTIDRFDMAEKIYVLVKRGSATSSANWDSLRNGQIVEGTVTGVNKGGLELEIGNVRAFMPIGQIDVQFHKDVSVFLNQRLKAEVTKVDRRAKNLIVSRRNLIEKERAESKAKLFETLAEGETRRGTITSVTDYGAFVDVGGADGLIHISELSHRRGTKASDVVRVGDVVDVKVTKFDRVTGKIGLSLKQLMADPWQGAESKYGVGMPVSGRVVKLESFGAFIELEEGLEGLLPVSEISYQRVKSVGEVLKENDILRLIVLALDTNAKRISLSLKQAGADPWKTAADKFYRGEVYEGTVTRTVDFGAFVELEPGLEGLVHISELADNRIRSVTDVAKIGQALQVKVVEIDPEKRRIALSVKQANRSAPVAAVAFVAEASPATPAKRKKPKQLRGGLEW